MFNYKQALYSLVFKRKGKKKKVMFIYMCTTKLCIIFTQCVS